jgi:hypothetical protein
MNLTEQKDVAVLVVSCDRFQDLWHPFFTCFFKYWPDCPFAVYLGSNLARYEHVQVRPILVGKDLDYSSNLLAMIDLIEQEWIITWIEDRALAAKVNTERVAGMIRRAQEQGAGYLKLIANHPFATAADASGEFGEIARHTPYRVSVTVALWHKPALLALLRRGESAWELERNGSERSNHLDAKFLSLPLSHRRDPPISDAHLIIKGHLLRDARKFLSDEGLQDCLRHRPLQTISSYWYVKAYLAALDLRARLNWRCR